MTQLSVLVVEPWMRGSHEAWATGYQRHSRHGVDVLGGIPQGWRATFENSAAQLAARVRSRPDVVIASSMFDLVTFQVESGLSGTPTVLFFHENQLTYDRSRADLERGRVNWESASAADQVVFNSEFHLDDFHHAVATQLEVDAATVGRAQASARVLPVGIDLPPPPTPTDGPPTVLWNHRWEHDKDPTTFVAALESLAGKEFQLILLGEGGERFRDRLAADRVVHAGFAPRDDYLDLIGRADLVVSTARQEFFGVSVAEAMAVGVVPLVPNRLAYPELLGPDLGSCLYEPGSFAERLRAAITSPGQWQSLRPVAKAAGSRFAWPRVTPAYDDLIESMV